MLIILSISEDRQSIICGIYDKYYNRMLYTATGILGSTRAEDAVHDSFVKLIEKFEEKAFANLGDKPGHFFVVLVRNHSIDLLRKDHGDLSLFDEESVDIFIGSIIDPEAELLENELNDKLVSLIRKLKPAARQILEYKYIVGYSNKEISEIMGISQTAVSTRINKAKNRLREAIENKEDVINAHE